MRRYRLRFSHRAEHSRMVVVLVLIGGMLALELLNTAIEHVVDLVTDQYHPLAKAAKDARRSRLRLCRDIVYHWFTHLLAEDMLAEDSYNYFTLPKWA